MLLHYVEVLNVQLLAGYKMQLEGYIIFDINDVCCHMRIINTVTTV